MVGNTEEHHKKAEKKLVICIDDMPEFVNLIGSILTRLDIEVVGARDGIEGLNKIRELKPDLVLLDLMMPKMNGWEVYWRMQTDDELRDIPVIIVSVRSEKVDRQLALESAKTDGYIAKPFSIQDLIGNVQRVLHPTG